MESRHNSTTPCKCPHCNWQGQEKDLVHTYKAIPFSSGDVEPVSLCPTCGNEDIQFEEKEPAYA